MLKSTENNNTNSQKPPQVTIYTDGSCLKNPGIGGWGAILIYDTSKGKVIKELSGSNPETTNNQMEMQAVIEALSALKKPCDIKLFTDSKYVLQGATEWIFNWKKNNFKVKGKEIKNQNLWVEINNLTTKHKINWTWVKGHSGDEFNERVDKLANGAATKLKEAQNNTNKVS